MPDNTIYTARAYAKINLGLHVNERLPNGYHDITTGFCFIDWSDQFRIQASDEIKLSVSDNSVPVDESNLIMKAYRLLEREIGLKQRYLISVNKKIPVGAGLGGGSSDAALTLRMLNKIEELDLSDEALIDLGKQLGADVPLFIKNEPAIGSGIGTDLTLVPIQPSAWIVTVYPNFESDTATAYQYCETNPNHDFEILDVLTNKEMDEWQYLLLNDLEPIVMYQHPMIGNVKDQLYDFGAIYASMSGSGSSIYGLFEQEFVANHAYRMLLEYDMTANLTRPDFKPDKGIYRLS
ncbi:MAG TPA: 4-(cytidine 5'-diphospho)-2-C-methyl-D-erythritol kinase [Balneolales bacterium]|nr:4-(cytidine 5'-diphospho)-2-C-methyl-D-erythritol kinase [Balneolales bacterium]